MGISTAKIGRCPIMAIFKFPGVLLDGDVSDAVGVPKGYGGKIYAYCINLTTFADRDVVVDVVDLNGSPPMSIFSSSSPPEKPTLPVSSPPGNLGPVDRIFLHSPSMSSGMLLQAVIDQNGLSAPGSGLTLYLLGYPQQP